MQERVLILGGGPAGMACAMELHRAGLPSRIIEKEQRIGGLARTLEFREGGLLFRTDIGPHRFFSKNQYLYEFIEGLIEERWILVPRRTRQYIDGIYYDYPIKPLQALRNIGLLSATGILFSYLQAAVRYKMFRKEIRSFEDYIVANFGRKLGEFNMLNYTEKIWGVPSSTLHPDWAKQRIKGLNFASIITNMFAGERQRGPKSLVDVFYYPQFGTGLIYDTIAEKVTAGGGRIDTESWPVRIELNGTRISKILLNVVGKQEEIEPETLISSIPITSLVQLFCPEPPREVCNAAAGLSWRGQVYLFVTLDKERVTEDNWVYFPSKDIPFGRVSEMKNFSVDMSPPGKTSLFIEFFVQEGDEVWNMQSEAIFDLAMEHVERIGLFARHQARNWYVFRQPYVYPVYDLMYQDNLRILTDYLDRFENLYCIGRSGRFRYTNQDHSLEMGIAAAKGILEGKRPDFDSMGSEHEYFEKGTLAHNAAQEPRHNTALRRLYRMRRTRDSS